MPSTAAARDTQMSSAGARPEAQEKDHTANNNPESVRCARKLNPSSVEKLRFFRHAQTPNP